MNRLSVARRVALVLAGVALVSASGCGMIEKPTAAISGVKLKDVSATSATMLFDVDVKNPYAVALPLSNVDYALASKGESFASGKADLQGTIPAGKTQTLGVPVKINFLELVKAVQGARPGAKIPYKADLGLSVDTPILGALRLPTSKEGELAIPTSQDLLNTIRDRLLR